ncbi:MAG: TolC family protein [Prevotella sp.]|nr:TolC family protein [Prevotella sp.]
MKKYSLFILLFFNILAGYSQEQQSQSLKLSREEIEVLFLKNNLQLIAEKFNIDIADAAIVQARLWDNPTLSIEGMNLWSTKSQRDEIEDMVTSSFVKNTEFSIELSQLILTANKRGKLIRREKVSKEIARQEFEKILRGLKAELRKSIYETQYLQAYLNILMNQRQSVNQLVESHRKQVLQGNIAKSELLRLQSSLLDLENEINDTQLDLEEQRKTLKILLNIDPFTHIEVADDPDTEKNPDNIILSDLLYIADESRPDMKQYKLQTQYYQRSLDYEKSQRIPNINISASYDRYGGVWKDFVGFGVSIDLPFFNRNQGNIKAAKLSIDQSQYLSQQQHSIIRHEITTAYNSYLHTYNFYKKIENNSLFSELDGMLDVYTKNLQYRNIGMLEYVDFMDTYKSSKQTMLTAKKNVSIQFEELQYTVGTDIK